MATLVRPRSEDFFAKMSCHEEKAWFRSAPGTRLPLVDLTPKYLTLVATTPRGDAVACAKRIAYTAYGFTSTGRKAYCTLPRNGFTVY